MTTKKRTKAKAKNKRWLCRSNNNREKSQCWYVLYVGQKPARDRHYDFFNNLWMSTDPRGLKMSHMHPAFVRSMGWPALRPGEGPVEVR